MTNVPHVINHLSVNFHHCQQGLLCTLHICGAIILNHMSNM